MLQCVIGVALAVFFLAIDSEAEDLSTGRFELWGTILERSLAQQTWLFGNGNGVYRATSGSSDGFASWVGQGHNQFVDSFFTGGILALVPLLVLTFVSAAWALRAGPHRPIALGAFAILFVDMMVEAPVRPAANAWILMSVIVLAIVTAHGGEVEQLSPASRHPSPDLRPERWAVKPALRV